MRLKESTTEFPEKLLNGHRAAQECDPLHPQQGTECIQPSPLLSKRLRLDSTPPSSRERLPAGVWPPGLTPGSTKEQGKYQGPREHKVRLEEATVLYLSLLSFKEQYLYFKRSDLQRL